MKKDIILREGSKVEDFSMESLLGGLADSCTFTCTNIYCAPNLCNDHAMYPGCQPNTKQLIEKPTDLTINLGF